MPQPARQRRGVVVGEPGGGLSPLLPASTTRYQGSPALSLGLGRGGFTIQLTPAGNVQNHPRAEVYKDPESAGGRSRIPDTVGLPPSTRIRPSPAS